MIYYYVCMYIYLHISVCIIFFCRYYVSVLCQNVIEVHTELPIINYKNLQLSLAISVSSAPINRTAVMIRIVPNMSVR